MAKRAMRIFQIAKELNISHTEIVSFLKSKGIAVASHMSPVNEDAYHLILTEFAKDKESVDRYRKEQVRREIHDTRLKQQQIGRKKLKLLTLEEQRRLEQLEQQKAEEERKAEEARLKAEQEQREQEEKAQQLVKETDSKPPVKKEKQPEEEQKKADKTGDKKTKKKLRRIDLTSIEAQVGQGTRRRRERPHKVDAAAQKSAKETVRQITARLDVKGKKKVYKKDKAEQKEAVENAAQTIKIAEFSSVDEIAKLFDVKPNEIIQKCIGLGVLATINQRLDWDIIELLAGEYNYTAEKLEDIGEELFSFEDTEEDIAKSESRAPVVTVMGHVDHGKTSLLDYIRKTNVVGGESGGITQHIGAYKVQLPAGQYITFLDTPGHEAFTAMRARGAKVTDIVILVVAANDGVMPQTIEAINHAKAANVPIIVAINKIDLPDIDLDRIKRELSEHGVLVEDWGGKVQAIPISAKTGAGVDDLLASMLIEAEMLELKANRDTTARGTIIDSRLDKGHGPIATVLIQKGVLNVGDPFICNNIAGKVRALLNERGQRIKEAGPSDAIQVLGFDRVPQSADIFAVVKDEHELKRIANERQRIKREIERKKIKTQSLDTMSAMIKEGAIKKLTIIIKGDVDGSIDALSEALEKLSTSEVGVQVIHKAVGMISESDVLLAAASNAVIIGFNVQVSSNARLQAKQEGVEIRSYSVIYNAMEDVKLAMEGLLEPELLEKQLGRAVVQASFKIPKLGLIAGSRVTEGSIIRSSQARVIRDEEEIGHGEIISLKRFKDDAREVKEGLECGIGIEGVKDFKEGDTIVCFEIQSVKRTLESN